MFKKSLFVMMVLIFFAPFLCLAADTPATGPRAFVPESVYEFAPVIEGTKIEHIFIIRNQGDAPLGIIDLKSG